jgi:predicted DNA-binding protein YlxM (UPF0122 family)
MFSKEDIKLLIKEFVSKTETAETIKNRQVLLSDQLLGKVEDKELTEAEILQGIKERETALINIIESQIFVEAVKLCVENNFCSTILLQKHFNIGFNKAVDIINSMEALNLLAPIEKDFLPKRRILSRANDFLVEKEEIMRKALNLLLEDLSIDDKNKLSINNDSLVLILAKINFIRSVVNSRQMEVLELLYGFKYGKCYSIEEIGQKFNVTRERVRQIKEKALQKLRYTQYRKVLLNSEQG